MNQETAMQVISRQEWLDRAADGLQPMVTQAFEAGGQTGQEIKNFLHGKWLGHQLHPVLTDVPVGAWTVAAVLDCAELAGRDEYAPGADAAIAIGLAGAVGAAVTGLTDWSATSGESRKVGLLHGLLNTAAATLYGTSLACRARDARGLGIGLSMLGYSVASVSAYLGGHLVFNNQVGVNHTAGTQGYPEEFTAVLPEAELEEGAMKCVHVGEMPVLLARQKGRIFALQNNCSHMNGPLNRGELLDDDSVRCPWHGSRYSLESGRVLDGPSTYDQPCFETRTRDGQIDIRKAHNDQ
jgi:nitrite reductase/ring-hydroxylating ferredoxin subunit/uncharacterized membrane protein